MLKKLPLLVALVSWAGYSYSESIAPYYGTTPNAASGGTTWSMDNVLPGGIPGLDIDLIIYNYTIEKDVDAQVDVYVQNKNANGTGYIFREHDQWVPGSLGGTEINKAVPVTPLNRQYWGDGEIAVEGNGSVSDPTVIYNYRVDPCYNPQFDPNCPGYQTPQPPQVETVDIDSLYDPLQDQVVQDALSSTDDVEYDNEEEKSDEELAEEKEQEEKDREQRLEKALAAAQNAVLFSEAFAQAQMLESMNRAINMSQYYAASISGGTYNDSVQLIDKEIPENKAGLRNGLAQQLMHEKMIDMQYNK